MSSLFKNPNLAMANQTVKSGLKAKNIKLLQFFILQNFKKILRADPELWGCAIFGPRMAHLSWTNFFKCKPFSLLSSTYWHFSLCKIWKNASCGSWVMRMRNFWVQNDPFPQIRIFSGNLLMSLVSFIHAYLYAKNQYQILIY